MATVEPSLSIVCPLCPGVTGVIGIDSGIPAAHGKSNSNGTWSAESVGRLWPWGLTPPPFLPRFLAAWPRVVALVSVPGGHNQNACEQAQNTISSLHTCSIMASWIVL